MSSTSNKRCKIFISGLGFFETIGTHWRFGIANSPPRGATMRPETLSEDATDGAVGRRNHQGVQGLRGQESQESQENPRRNHGATEEKKHSCSCFVCFVFDPKKNDISEFNLATGVVKRIQTLS